MKKTMKLLCLLMTLSLCFSLFAGCGDKEQEDAENGAPEAKRDDIIIATANETPTLAPYQHSSVAGNYMNILTHNSLFRPNIETLTPEPSLVEDYEILNDRQWEFHLKKGVKFHNGEEMTAEDVKASMERARELAVHTMTYSQFWESVEVVDDYTFIITTKDVYAKTLYDLTTHWIMPKSLIDSGNDFNENPVGTGPYKFVKWTLGDKIEFEAFEDYWEGAPEIKHLTYRIIPEGSSRTIALEAGEIDFIIEVDNNDLGRLEESEGITVLNRESTHFNFLSLNNERPPFDNRDFRHALNCAIDKEALVQVALNGAGIGNFTQSPSAFEGSATEIPDSHNIEEAKRYIEKSGIDPATVEFNCICSDDIKRRCGEVIQSNLAELGITMNLESMDLATYLSAAAEGRYDACLGGDTPSNLMSFIDGNFTSKSINGGNWTRTNDLKIDELYEKATKTLDEAERIAVLEECTNYINEICPQVPTYSANITRAYNSDLQGIEVSAANTLRWQYVKWAD